MPFRKSIASVVGVAFALSCPFLNWSPVLSHVPAPGIMLQFATASALAAISFGINKRSLKFFCIRSIGWRDIGAALLTFPARVVLFALALPIIHHFADVGTESAAASHDIADYPLWLGLMTAVGAGVFEEFIFRGFLIEELGELVRSRYAAAAVSAVFFALAHHMNLGWSIELIRPGLGGVAITGLYLWRRNLPVCMLLHATIDSIHVLAK